MKTVLLGINLILVCTFLLPLTSRAEEETSGLELGEEYIDYHRSGPRGAVIKGKAEQSFGEKVLLYIPNRLVDLIDVIRADVGVGPSFGAVGRVTKWGQFGYRGFAPASLRVGLRGRKSPILLEHTNEFGAGPAFVSSEDREATPLEIGVGADLFLAGAYVGISLDQTFDLLAGIVGLDPLEDDF